jgi:probable F420-dependent oxidoreductase
MRYGVTIFATDRSIGVVELARAVEERGLESLWLPEHTHIPTSRRTPYPMGGELPQQYKRCLDPFVALTAAAIAAPTLRLGTAIMLAAQHDPIVTAKAAASLDLVSGGRFTLGVGFGWNEDEMNNHAVDYPTRRRHAREHILAMRSLWEDEVARFEGEHVHLSPSWSWPKPLQNPLPVLVGGAAGPKLFDHIVDYGQGWIPIGGKGITDGVAELRARFEAAGRDPDDVQVVTLGSSPDHGKLDHFEKLGVTECVFDLPSATGERVLPRLDRYAAFVAERER